MKRILSVAMAFVLLFSMVPLCLAEDEAPAIVGIDVETTGNIVENWNYGQVFVEEDEDGNPIFKDGYYYEEALSITLEFSDDTQMTGPYYEIDWYLYENYGLSVLIVDDQSEDNVWGLGEHAYAIKVGALTASDVITVVPTPVKNLTVTCPDIVAGTFCTFSGEYDAVTGEEGSRYLQYYFYDLLQYEVEMEDGIYTGNADEIWEQLEFYPTYNVEQSYENPLGIGAHTGIANVMGFEAEFSFNILKGDMAYFTIADTTILEGNYQYFGTYYDPETETMKSYSSYNYSDAVEFTLVMQNEETIVGTASELMAQGINVFIDDNQSYTNQWGVGEHTFTAYIFGEAVTGRLTIEGSNITDISAACPPISFHTNGWLNVFTDENGEVYESWYQYDYVHLLTYTVSYDDETSETLSYDEFCAKFGVAPSVVDDQSGSSEWQPGIHTSTLYFRGQSFEVEIEILASPIKSISGTATCIENWDMNEHTDIDEEGNQVDWLKYHYQANLQLMVEFTDGTTFEGTALQLEEQYGYGITYHDDQTREDPWEVGTHTVQMSLLGVSGEAIVTVEESPIESMEVTFNAIGERQQGCWQLHTTEDGEEVEWFEYAPDANAQFTIRTKDGAVYEGGYDIFPLLEEVWPKFTTDQSYENQWGVGTHNVTVNVLGYITEATVEIQASPVKAISAACRPLILNYHGSVMYKWNSETDEYDIPFFRYDYYGMLQITVTLADDSVVTMTPDEIYNTYGWAVSTDDNQWTESWGEGDHTVSISLLDCATTVDISVVPGPVKSIELAEDAILYEDVDGFWSRFDDMPFYAYSLETKVNLVVTMRDGTVYRGTVNQILAQNPTLGLNVTNYQWETPLTVGENTMKVVAMGCSAELPVTVRPYPIKDFDFAQPIVLNPELHGETFAFWVDELGDAVECTVYDFEPKFSVTLDDDTVFTGSADEIFERFNDRISVEAQGPDNLLVSGENTLTYSFMNREWDLNVTISDEVPIKEIAVERGDDTVYVHGRPYNFDDSVLTVTYADNSEKTYPLQHETDNNTIMPIYDEYMGIYVRPQLYAKTANNINNVLIQNHVPLSYCNTLTHIVVDVEPLRATLTVLPDEQKRLVFEIKEKDGSTETYVAQMMKTRYTTSDSDGSRIEYGTLTTDKGTFEAIFNRTEEGVLFSLEGVTNTDGAWVPMPWYDIHCTLKETIPYMIDNDVCYNGEINFAVLSAVAAGESLFINDNYLWSDSEYGPVFYVDADATVAAVKRVLNVEINKEDFDCYNEVNNCFILTNFDYVRSVLDYEFAWDGSQWVGTAKGVEGVLYSVVLDEELRLISLQQFSPKGDISGDGVVDTVDVVSLMRQINLGAEDAATGDLNGDGVVSLADVLRLLKMVSE